MNTFQRTGWTGEERGPFNLPHCGKRSVGTCEERCRGPPTYFHDVLRAISIQFEHHGPRGMTYCFEDVVHYNVSTRAHITEGGRVRHPGCKNRCNSPHQTFCGAEPPRDGGVVNGGASMTIFLVVESDILAPKLDSPRSPILAGHGVFPDS
eukprot:scaffold12890_cov52-Attheya_sp.AAC.7